MATIIAGRFALQEQVQDAISALSSAGFAQDRITSFYVNPPGQHDLYPIGGDRDKSPGAEHSGEGVAMGGAVGAAIGAAAAPIIGPAGPVAGALVGAHLGSLVGTLSQMNEGEETPPVRHSGMLVAVEAPNGEAEARAIDTMHALGATDIERAEGTIADGEWRDFDPLGTPGLVDQERERRG